MTETHNTYEVVVDLKTVVEGENTYQDTQSGKELVLIWNGEHFSLRAEDANNPDFGTVGITLVDPASARGE